MKILLIGSYPPPYGGQSIHIKQLREYILRCGDGCIVLDTGEKGGRNGDNGVVAISSIYGLIAYSIRESYDIIHVHVSGYQNYNKMVPAFLASRIFGRKWVITFHSGRLIPPSSGKLSIYFIRKMLKRADKVICVNKDIKDLLGNEGIAQSKCVVNPAFSMDNDVGNVVSLDERAERFFAGKKPVISCLGMYEPLYGFERVLTCVCRLKTKYPNIGLVIVASGGSRKKEFLNALEKSGEKERVLVLEDVVHEQCLEVMRRSDAFSRPTYYDGDSISVREAVSMGVPVFASRTAYRPEGVILFDVNNPDDMLRAAEEAVESRKKVVKKNEKENEKKSDNLENLMNVYREIILT